MVIASQPVCVAPTGDKCGEAPVWHAGEQALYWTDINRFLIHRFDTRTATVKSWIFDEPVVALGLTGEDGLLAVGLGSRLTLWNPASGEMRDRGFHLPGWPAVRLNEGRPDPRGSFWLGSMRNNVAPDGAPRKAGGTDGVLYRIDPGGAVTEWKRGIGISNTMVWNAERTRFYFGDSLNNTVCAYDYDAATGAIGGERPFFADFDRGRPDGSAIDSEGCVWNCRYGGKCIVRLNPDGAIDRVLEMPASNMTSCTFGGPDLKTLYATSAGLDAPAGERFAGGLFAVDVDVAGLPENRFRLF